MFECPKCGRAMATKDRSGIMIEECAGCRGVYLDRGELELLIAAESEYLATLPAPENADTTYQGRHRHGVVRQVFGEQVSDGQPGSGNSAAAAEVSAEQAANGDGAEQRTNGDGAEQAANGDGAEQAANGDGGEHSANGDTAGRSAVTGATG